MDRTGKAAVCFLVLFTFHLTYTVYTYLPQFLLAWTIPEFLSATYMLILSWISIAYMLGGYGWARTTAFVVLTWYLFVRIVEVYNFGLASVLNLPTLLGALAIFALANAQRKNCNFLK